MIAFLGTALAGDAVVDGVAAEVERAVAELRLPDTPGPYFVAALVNDVTSASTVAALGGLVASQVRPYRQLGLVVHTGSPALDNTNFESFADGLGSRSLVHGDDPVAVRHDVWLLADRCYKEAVEALAAKQAVEQRRAERDDVADFAPGLPQQEVADGAPPVDAEALEQLARELSATFLDHPGIEWSTVYAAAETGRRVMIDTGGTRVVAPVSEVGLRVVARARAPDGATTVDEELFLASTLEDLPSRAVLDASVASLIARLEAWRELPVPDEEYVGPVLFEGEAAVDLFRWLLLPALAGTPPQAEAPHGSRVVVWDEQGNDSATSQPRRRVLPVGWEVDDDPMRDPGAPWSYRFDWEGQPAEAVTLVEDGIVRGHLMSRIPSEAFDRSNGHARAFPGDLPKGAPADVRVTAPGAASARKVHKAASKLASDYGADHYVAVRRWVDPVVASMDGGPMMTGRDLFGFGSEELPTPLEAVRVYRDGREQPIRGVALSALDVRSLKEIVLAGEDRKRAFLLGAGRDPLAGFPTVLSAPDVLVGEVVVSPDREDAEKPPILPSPLAERVR